MNCPKCGFKYFELEIDDCPVCDGEFCERVCYDCGYRLLIHCCDCEEAGR